MLKFMLVLAVVLGTVMAGLAPAQAAELTPKKASELVTLVAGGACPVGSAVAVGQLQAADGTVAPFSGPPLGKALIITDVEFELGTGISAGTLVVFHLLRVVPPTSVNIVARATPVAVDSSGGVGIATANVQIPRGAAVRPGVALCLCANPGAGCSSSGFAVVHGFIAPDN